MKMTVRKYNFRSDFGSLSLPITILIPFAEKRM